MDTPLAAMLTAYAHDTRTLSPALVNAIVADPTTGLRAFSVLVWLPAQSLPERHRVRTMHARLGDYVHRNGWLHVPPGAHHPDLTDWTELAYDAAATVVIAANCGLAFLRRAVASGGGPLACHRALHWLLDETRMDAGLLPTVVQLALTTDDLDALEQALILMSDGSH